jgi:hypothetical protein
MIRFVVLALALALVAPAGAAAGTASDTAFEGVFYVADSGETNRITATFDGSAVVFHDEGAPVAVDGCTPIDEHTARCETTVGATVDTGDGDDDVRVSAQSRAEGVFKLRGGDGDDVIRGGRSREVIEGGPGRDVVRAGAGNDNVNGDDRYAPAASDIIEGGRGSDTINYAHRRARVKVDLRKGLGGESGEADKLSGLENVRGGAGPDLLAGGAGPNRLRSGGNEGAGRDVLLGRGGDDRLAGESGPDLLVGGDGDDRIFGNGGTDRLVGDAGDDVINFFEYDPSRSTFHCGSGADLVVLPLGHTLVRPACERIDVDDFVVDRKFRYDPDGDLRLRIKQTLDFGPPAWCRVAVELRDSAGAVLGTTAHRSRVGHPTWVRVPLNARGRAAVRDHRRASIGIRGASGCRGPMARPTSGFDVVL